MHFLPFLLAFACAAALAPALMHALEEGGHIKLNYRERPLPFPFGVLIPAGALLALVPLTLLSRLASAAVFEPQAVAVFAYALGVMMLGLIDDTLGAPHRPSATVRSGYAPSTSTPGAVLPSQEAVPSGSARGLRGHARAALGGRLSTGALKAAGSLGLALLAMSLLGRSDGRWLLAAAVLVLATHAFNLLDVRPGRSAKAFVLLAGCLAAGSQDLRPLWAVGLFAGPALVAGIYDLRERAMLGDTGASLLGALAGLMLVLTLSSAAQLAALAALALLAIYGELRSIGVLIERTPVLRELDSLGRAS